MKTKSQHTPGPLSKGGAMLKTRKCKKKILYAKSGSTVHAKSGSTVCAWRGSVAYEPKENEFILRKI